MTLGITLTLGSQQAAGAPPELSPLDQLRALLRATGGQSAIHDYSLASTSSGTWISPDLSGNGNHHTQATVSQRPGITPDGAVFSASTHNVRQNITGGSFTIVLTFEKAASTNGFMLTNQLSAERLRYQSGNNGGLGSIVQVNGVQVTTPWQLFTALDGTGRCVVRAQGVDFR